MIQAKKRFREVPLLHLEQVLMTGKGVGISSDAVRACSDAGMPIHFLGSSGTLYSVGLTGTVLTRRAQLRAYDGPAGVALARAFAMGKLQNQGNLLRYLAKNRKESDPACYAALTEAATALTESLHALHALSGTTVEAVREPPPMMTRLSNVNRT